MSGIRWLVLVGALACALGVRAFGGAVGWISRSGSDSTEQVLFRRTYVFKGCPRMARIRIASRGRYVVYVNGYNVSASVLEPGVAPLVGGVCARSYDVSRYMQADSNTVAVWYSPVPPCPSASGQVWLVLSGAEANGSPFAYFSDESWLCRSSGGATAADGSETYDATLSDARWHSSDFVYPSWRGVSCAKVRHDEVFREVPQSYVALRVSHVYDCAKVEAVGPRVTYRFAHSFNGWVRLTLRGMARGAVVGLGGLRYVCSGQTDEQACRRFTTLWQDATEVTLPQGATIDNVQTVEGIEIAPYWHDSWRF